MVKDMTFPTQNEQCSHCGENVSISRPFSGQVLCPSCFQSSILAKVQRAISEWNMIQRTDRIAVAYSGGKDSTALLALLVKIQNQFSDLEVIAITLEEGVSEAQDRSHTLSLTTQLFGVEHVTASYQDFYGVTLDEIHQRAQELNSPLSTCAYCGVLRRQGLNKLAREINSDKLALGHNLDDEVQSMMMNMIRGDLKRLSRLAPVLEGVEDWLIPRIKPLYHVLESEIIEYANELPVPYYKCPCIYGEQSIRTELRHWLNAVEVKNPGTKYHLSTSFMEVIRALKTESRTFQKCNNCGEPTSREFCSACEYLRKLFPSRSY